MRVATLAVVALGVVSLSAIPAGPVDASTTRSTSSVRDGAITLDAANSVSRIALNDRFKTQLIASDPGLGAAFYRPSDVDGATNTAVFAVTSDGATVFDSLRDSYAGGQDSGGSGTSSDPFWIRTSAVVVNGPEVNQRHSYIEGADFVRTDLSYTNRRDTEESVKLSAWADCYFAGSDLGYAEVQAAERIASCKTQPEGPYISFAAASADATPAAGRYTATRDAVRTGFDPLPNDCLPAGSCDVRQDNGMAVAFHFTVQPGETVTKTYFTKYTRDMKLTNLQPHFQASRSSMLVGDDITFSIDLDNHGNMEATNTHARFPLPAGFEYVSSASSAGTTYDSSTGTWTLGTLAGGASASLSVTARATEQGESTLGLTSVGSDAIDLDACTALGDPKCGGTAQVIVNQELVLGNSTIDASPRTVVADGAASSTVTVTLRDRQGDPIDETGHDVAFTPSIGSIGSVTDHGDGTYSAPWTSTSIGTGTASFTVDGASPAPTATVDFIVGAPSHDTSSATVTEGEIAADGRTKHLITVTLADSAGHPLTGHVDKLAAASTDDLGEGEITGFAETATVGTYAAAITSTVPGKKLVTAMVDDTLLAMTGNDTAVFVKDAGPGAGGPGSGAASTSESATVGTSPTAGSLARTGSDLLAPIAAALAATLGGAGLFWFALLRRRRTSA